MCRAEGNQAKAAQNNTSVTEVVCILLDRYNGNITLITGVDSVSLANRTLSLGERQWPREGAGSSARNPPGSAYCVSRTYITVRVHMLHVEIVWIGKS